MKVSPSVLAPDHPRNGVEILTWGVHCSVDENVDPKAELYGSNRIQDAPDPFVLPRDRVSSVVM